MPEIHIFREFDLDKLIYIDQLGLDKLNSVRIAWNKVHIDVYNLQTDPNRIETTKLQLY